MQTQVLLENKSFLLQVSGFRGDRILPETYELRKKQKQPRNISRQNLYYKNYSFIFSFYSEAK